MANMSSVNELNRVIQQEVNPPAVEQKPGDGLAGRKVEPLASNDGGSQTGLQNLGSEQNPPNAQPLAKRAISDVANWVVVGDEQPEAEEMAPEEKVRTLLGAEPGAIAERDMATLVRIRQDFRAFARRLADPNASSYRVADDFGRLMDQLPRQAEKRELAFKLLQNMIEDDADTVLGGKMLRAIAARADFKSLHLSLVSFAPALAKLVAKGNPGAPSEASLQTVNGMRDLLDTLVRRIGRKSPAAVKPEDVSYQDRSDFVKVFGAVRNAVTRVLPQPKARTLCSLKGQSQLPNGPKTVGETRRLLMRCLDDYKTHERSFDPYDVHGRTHATRVFVFGNVLGNILREKGLKVDVNAVAMMGAGHDSGREANQRDVFEDKSANLTRRHIRETFGENAGAGKYVDEVADAISSDESNARSVEAYLLHCADSLDFWRVAPVEMEAFPFLREVVVGEDEQGQPVTVQIDQNLREALVAESHELMKLTHEFAALDREAEALQEKENPTEEEQARYREIQQMQADGSDWRQTVWAPRMNRSNEEVVASIEQAIRGNPTKFPLLKKHYLDHVDPNEALGTIRSGLVGADGKVDAAGVRSGLEAFRSQMKDLERSLRSQGVTDISTLYDKCDRVQSERMVAYAQGLSNEELTVMYQALLGRDVEALKAEFGRADDSDALGILLDLEAAVVSETAKRCDQSAANSVDAGNGMQTSSMATLVETTTDAYLRTVAKKEVYESKMGQVFKKPIDVRRIGDILRDHELTINFNPLYLFGDLKKLDVNRPFPIDSGDHIYQNLFNVKESGVDVDPGVLDFRRLVEDLRFPKIGDRNLSGKARPTYSAVNGVGLQGAASQYGHAVIVLKPKCKRRATYTYGETDYQTPISITAKNEQKFIKLLLERADQLCAESTQEQKDSFIRAMDTPNSAMRQAIHRFFTDPKHATDPNYTRMEYFESEMMAYDAIPDWLDMAATFGLRITADNNTLSSCLLESCADPDRLVGKQVDFEHLENLVPDMKDYDDVRMNLAAVRDNGRHFVLEGVGFIEAQLHQQINVYEDVAEIRFTYSMLPDRNSPEYQRTVDALNAWGEAHGIKITITTRLSEDEAREGYQSAERSINNAVEEDLAGRTKPVKIEKFAEA